MGFKLTHPPSRLTACRPTCLSSLKAVHHWCANPPPCPALHLLQGHSLPVACAASKAATKHRPRQQQRQQLQQLQQSSISSGTSNSNSSNDNSNQQQQQVSSRAALSAMPSASPTPRGCTAMPADGVAAGGAGGATDVATTPATAAAATAGVAVINLVTALEQLGPDVVRTNLWQQLGPSSRQSMRASCRALLALADEVRCGEMWAGGRGGVSAAGAIVASIHACQLPCSARLGR